MRTELVADALRAAEATRGSLTRAIFHSDHGAQYTSAEFAALCNRLGVRQSMGAVGTSADNAAAEAFNATLKRETLQGARHGPPPTPPAWPSSDGLPARTLEGDTPPWTTSAPSSTSSVPSIRCCSLHDHLCPHFG